MATESNSPLVIGSTIFSLLTMTMTVAGDDALSLGWSIFDGKTWWKWAMLHLWRVLDIVSKLAMYALFYNAEGGGVVTAAMLGVSLSIGVFVYFIIKIKLCVLLCFN